MTSSLVRTLPLQLFSTLVASFILFSIFAVYTSLVGQFYILTALLTLASAVALRYVSLYHQFSNQLSRKLILGPLTIGFIASAAVSLETLHSTVSLSQLLSMFQGESIQFGSANFLPPWWIATFLLPAGCVVLVASVVTRDFTAYPKPTEIRTIATSPAYFGLTCSVIGLWAVLFVGVAIQRVVVIAPIFEELLKFGIALLVGGVLFGRSFAARIAVAFVVGALFGLVEHATTYPTETDMIYLFRTVFHGMTTVLSVAAYTLFESQDESRLQWIAPTYSVLLHFFYNTFVVLSALISVLVFGSQSTLLPLVYGSAVILLASGLLLLTIVYRDAVIAIYRPFEYILSDLV